MGRIIFLNCYAHEVVSGGIKTMYQHAFLLREAGFDAQVMQVDGVPPWLDQKFAPLVCESVSDLADDDILVFPETLESWYAEMIRAPLKGMKVIFCQNPHYFFTCRPTRQQLEEWGVRRVLAPGRRTSLMVQSVLGLDEVPVASPVVDDAIFQPRPKRLQIAVSYTKWPEQPPYPQYAGVIRDMFQLKYPRFSDIPWVPLYGRSEAEMGVLLGESAICLSLARLEALGMVALEAMAAGCIVVGFHGGGGLDYVTPQNGFWHSPEALEGIVDSMAAAVLEVSSGGAVGEAMKTAARRTALSYCPVRVSAGLQRLYKDILRGSA